VRAVLALLLGLVVGAAGFHLWYLNQPAAARCGWDHPFDAAARTACRAGATPGYAAKARADMDALVGTVSR
jgi:hypothetical protein